MKNKFKIKYTALLTMLIACFSFHANAQSCADGSYQFSDMVAIFQSNGCNGCHGSQGGLDLSNYNNVINGGNNGVGGCGPYANALDYLIGKVDGSLTAGDGCGQAMPLGTPYGTAGMSVTDIAAVQSWIDAGAPQGCPPPPCMDIVASAQPVCNGTAGTFDIQINSITGGDGSGDPTGTYTVTDGTNTITYPTETTITGLTYTGQNDKITLTITDNDDAGCSVTYDVLQLECLDQTVCECGVDNPFNINAQASANGDGYSMVYALTDASGTVISVNQTGSFGSLPDDGATYNVYAYNVADADLAGLEVDLSSLIGGSVDPSLTASQAAPFDAYCYTDMTASFTENCEVLFGEFINEGICIEDAIGFDLTSLESPGETGGVWMDNNGNIVSSADIADNDIFIYMYTGANGCPLMDTLEFMVNEGTMLVADAFLCPEDAVTDYDLTPNEPVGTTGTWNVADPTSVDVTAGGSFVYTYADLANGCTSTIEVGIDILDGVSFTLDDISLCEGQIGILEPMGLDDLGSYTYAWSDGTTTPTLIVNFEGDYTLMVMDAFGCIGSATATVTFLPACDATCTTTQSCDDGNPCTINDEETIGADGSICIPCAGTVDASSCDTACTTTQACDDGDPLTINDVEVVAADGSICTVCAGVPAEACSETTVESCDDGNPCTINDQQEVSNLDGSICVPCAGTVDASSCDAACTTTQACDDGDPLTINDMEVVAADGSICTACMGVPAEACSDTTIESCDDGDPCTIDDEQEVSNLDGSICVPCAGTAIPGVETVFANLTTAYCEGATTEVLPTTDDNGITGTWNPTVIDNTVSGSYVFTPDATVCANSFTLDVTINTNPTVQIDNPSVCLNELQGGFDLTTLEPAGQTGGTWSPSSIATEFDVTEGELYTYTYTDANGCMGSASIVITIEFGYMPLNSLVEVCSSATMGYDLTALLTNPDLTNIVWTLDGQTIADPTNVNVSDGENYTAITTSPNGCLGNAEFIIVVVEDGIEITAIPTCNSANEGTFFIEIQGITGGSQTSDYIVEANGLSVNYTGSTVTFGPFTYTDHNTGITLNVTSVSGCTATYDVLQLNCADQEVCDCTNPDAPYTITAQAAANGNGYSMIYALVNNDNNNMVEGVNDTGIFSDLADNTNYTVYAFNVEDIDLGGFTADLNSLMMISAGDEVLTNMGAFVNYCYEAANAAFVEDCSCLSCDTFVVDAVVTDLTCNGDGSGAIDLTAMGGLAPYTYAWSNGATTEDLTGLDGGAYTVTVNDASECSDVVTLIVGEPAAIGISNVSITDPTCNANDGTIVVAVENGVAPFTYEIDDLGISQSDNTITGVPAGTYTVTVTDDNGCTAFIPVTLTGTDAPTATVAVNQAPDCDESNGVATVTAAGGTPPYDYLWSDGQTTATATGLAGGTYTVIVTDADGCSVTESITLIPVGCDFSITNTFFANDGCKCNNDQSDNGAGDGTFTETVTVLAPAGLIIRADVTSTGIEDPVNQGLSSSTLPIEFYETFPGRYILIFNHIDRIGYTINVEYSTDGGNTFIPVPNGAGGQLSYSNVCAYPVLAFNPPLEEAYCEDDGIVVIGVVETSDNVDFEPLQGYPAVALNNEEAQPAPLTFDPSTVGTATYTFSGFYNYENGTGTGGTVDNPAVSLNPCATLIRVNVPVNPVPMSEATCEQTGPEEFIIDVDPTEDYEEPENLMYRIGNSGPFQMSDVFVVEEDGDYEMTVVDMVSACQFQVPATCFRQLPIELIAFEGTCADDEYVLTWTTATEEDVSHFVVERSIDGQSYVPIAEVPAVGNSTVVQTYGYKDASGLSRQYYYRLRIIEFSGTETLSRIESVSCLTGGFGVLDVYPNPTQDEVAVTFEVSSRDRLNIRLVDVLGRTVDTQEFTPDIGLNRTVIDMSLLPSAMYYIVLEDGTQQSIEKVVKK